MKKSIALIVPAVTTIAVLATFAIFEAQRLPNWRLELDQYLEFTSVPSETVSVLSVARAGRPWNYTLGMASPVLTDWRWQGIDIPSPRKVQCVLIERTRPSSSTADEMRTREVVLVSYHTDLLWNVGWVVHELPGDLFTQQSQETLAALGCGFKPEP